MDSNEGRISRGYSASTSSSAWARPVGSPMPAAARFSATDAAISMVYHSRDPEMSGVCPWTPVAQHSANKNNKGFRTV